MSFQQHKILLFSFIFLWEMKIQIEAKLTDYENSPYSQLIALRK